MKRNRRLLPTTAIQLSAAALSLATLSSAELLYQEGFNTDGSTGANPRYTFTGKDVLEVPEIQAIPNFDQKGPIYWAHNFEVSYVGNPTIPGRRAIFTYLPDTTGTPAATTDMLQLWDGLVRWLLNNKQNATIVVNPNVAAIGELADRLTSSGHTVVDDDTTTYPDEQDVPGDLFIHGVGANNPSRFALVPEPVIVMNDPDYDDMLVGSIGSRPSFDPGLVTIQTPTHPAAGGKTGTFTGFSTGPLNFGIVGSYLPTNATTIATVTRTIPPAINNLSDVDAVIAGTKQNENSAGTTAAIDFGDGSAGSWFDFENTVPGGYAGNWGLRIQGQLTVSAAGTYRFALGSDDGARLYIDLDRNGITAADIIREDAGPHGHQIVYDDVTFSASGNYAFEVRSYNSGGGGSVELSASLQATPVPDDALDSGYWEVVSTSGTGPVKLAADANVTAYIATGANVQVQTPLVVVLNGPSDTPPGTFYDGGPFSGFEGTGFIGASGLNKWPYPDGQSYRTLQLAPVNVTGKTNVKVTIKLAATVVDFEDSDLLDVVVYTNGPTSNPTILAHFRGVQNAVQPWLADQRENYTRRLTRQFADFTYDVPAGATQLIVEIRAATTWWTEIAAFDDIRITAGATSTADPTLTSIAKQGNNIVVTFANGTLQRATALSLNPAQTQWQDLNNSGTYTVTPSEQGSMTFFRVRR
ncbi:MAG TPA: PA14 domain-containing protein [Verrucomicrobiae bacterium]